MAPDTRMVHEGQGQPEQLLVLDQGMISALPGISSRVQGLGLRVALLRNRLSAMTDEVAQLGTAISTLAEDLEGVAVIVALEENNVENSEESDQVLDETAIIPMPPPLNGDGKTLQSIVIEPVQANVKVAGVKLLIGGNEEITVISPMTDEVTQFDFEGVPVVLAGEQNNIKNSEESYQVLDEAAIIPMPPPLNRDGKTPRSRVAEPVQANAKVTEVKPVIGGSEKITVISPMTDEVMQLDTAISSLADDFEGVSVVLAGEQNNIENSEESDQVLDEASVILMPPPLNADSEMVQGLETEPVHSNAKVVAVEEGGRLVSRPAPRVFWERRLLWSPDQRRAAIRKVMPFTNNAHILEIMSTPGDALLLEEIVIGKLQKYFVDLTRGTVKPKKSGVASRLVGILFAKEYVVEHALNRPGWKSNRKETPEALNSVWMHRLARAAASRCDGAVAVPDYREFLSYVGAVWSYTRCNPKRVPARWHINLHERQRAAKRNRAAE